MPWHIQQQNGKWCVVKDSDDSVEKCHGTHDEAIAHMAALYAAERDKAMDDTGTPATGHVEIKFGVPIQVEDIKEIDQSWQVEGYASTFGNTDLGNDVVMPSAFRRTLANGAKVRFLHSHDPRLILGVPKNLKTDRKGLFGTFKISRTQLGEEAHQLLLDGALDSFSIGYVAKQWEYDKNNVVRQLKDVDLLEVSLVAMPMNPEAVVTNVKDYLKSLGMDSVDEMTLTQKAEWFRDRLATLIADLNGLVESTDGPLNQKKQQEFEALLEMFSGMDGVRSNLERILAADSNVVSTVTQAEAKRVHLELADRRRRLARILMEETS